MQDHDGVRQRIGIEGQAEAGSAGKPVSLKGWDADGKLVVDFDPRAAGH